MVHVEPSFVLYARLLDLGCCLRAHTLLSGTVERVEPAKKNPPPFNPTFSSQVTPSFFEMEQCVMGMGTWLGWGAAS